MNSDTPSVDGRTIGQRLREARETLGITQEDAAKALGIPRTSVSSLEAGRRRVSATELDVLAKVYRRSIDWFVTGRSDEPDTKTEALFRAAQGLSDDDRDQVLRFVQFLASAGPAPRGRYPSDDET